MSFTEMPLYHYIAMAIGWPSKLLYILMIISVVKHRQKNLLLRSSFFNTVLAEVNSRMYPLFYVEFLMRTRKFGYLQMFEKQTNSFLVEAVFFGHNSLRYVVVLGFLPVAFNRFSAIHNPMTYGKLWTLPFTLLLVSCCWVGGLAIAAPIYLYPGTNFSYLPNRYGRLTLAAGDDVLNYDSISAICTVSSVFGICSVVYIISFASYRRAFSKTEPFHSSQKLNDNFLLLLSSLLTFTTLSLDVCINIIQTIAVAVNNGPIINLTFDLWFVTTELMCISQPWCLLCTNRTVRRYLLRCV
ncbi:hypothetical protein PMAYCL1PPCAC_26033, partial [Pristionchus mayeri]